MDASTPHLHRRGEGPRQHFRAQAWPALLGIALVLLAGSSTWFGYLDEGRSHPALKIGLSMAITVWGLGSVLLVRLMQQGEREAIPDLLGTGVGLLSMAAAVIHLAVIRQHFVEYWLYGWFFLLVGVAQLVWAILVVIRPTRFVLLAGAVGNISIALLWVVTRTYGTVIGPDATSPEAVGFGDLISTLFEVVIATGALILIRSVLSGGAGRSRAGDVVSGFVALVVAALTSLSLYSAVGGHPFVSHVG